MAETLNCKKREKFGKLNTRRLRREGRLPAVIYGHGEETVNIELAEEEFQAAMRHGEKLVELKGDLNETALIHDMQWGPLGNQVLHIDLMRVSAGERIEVEVAIDLRGVAPGASEGVVNQLLHEVVVETIPSRIPEKLHVNINELKLHDTLTVADIEDLPEGATLQVEPDSVVVECVEQQAELEADEDAAAATSAEPEVIGQSGSDGEGEEDA